MSKIAEQISEAIDSTSNHVEMIDRIIAENGVITRSNSGAENQEPGYMGHYIRSDDPDEPTEVQKSDNEPLVAENEKLRAALETIADQAGRATLVQDRSVRIIKQVCAEIAKDARAALKPEKEDDLDHRHMNIPITMDPKAQAETYRGAESECPVCQRQKAEVGNGE